MGRDLEAARNGTGAGELGAFLARELGDARVGVEVEGPEGEIAVVRVPAALLPRLLDRRLRDRVVARARAAGFRYAAVELSEARAAAPADSAGRE